MDDFGEPPLEEILEILALAGGIFSIGYVFGADSKLRYVDSTKPIEKKTTLDKNLIAKLEEIFKAQQEKNRQKEEELSDQVKDDIKIITFMGQSRLPDPDREPDYSLPLEQVKRVDGVSSKMYYARGVMFRVVLFAIEKRRKHPILENLSHYTFDIPVKGEKGGTNLVRLTRNLSSTTVDFHVLKPYKSEPLYPRLFFKESTNIEGKQLPEEIRDAATSVFQEHVDKGKLPFSDRQLEILSIILADPEISAAQIGIKLGIRADTVSEHLDKIAYTAWELFETLFAPKKRVAIYWHEMGMGLKNKWTQ